MRAALLCHRLMGLAHADRADVLGPGEIRWLSVRTQPFTD
jgi:hypothetical protein